MRLSCVLLPRHCRPLTQCFRCCVLTPSPCFLFASVPRRVTPSAAAQNMRPSESESDLPGVARGAAERRARHGSRASATPRSPTGAALLRCVGRSYGRKKRASRTRASAFATAYRWAYADCWSKANLWSNAVGTGPSPPRKAVSERQSGSFIARLHRLRVTPAKTARRPHTHRPGRTRSPLHPPTHSPCHRAAATAPPPPRRRHRATGGGVSACAARL
jgi:hypothetical protein